ncbi:MAG TPA: STAS domain-containing protein [Humisphaera sp.]
MPVNIKLVSVDADAARVAVTGEVRRADADPTGVNPLEGLLGRGWAAKRVLLDASGASYVDSAAIGWLVYTAREMKKAGGGLAMHSAPPLVDQMLRFVKIHTIFPIVPTEQAAIEALDAAGKK